MVVLYSTRKDASQKIQSLRRKWATEIRRLERKRIDKQICILRAIANAKKPVNKYQICHPLKTEGNKLPVEIHDTEVSRCIKSFKKGGLIEAKRRPGHGPGSGEFYRLTFSGLVRTLSWISGIHDLNFNDITENYKSLLPLIFGKWNYLRDRKLGHASETMLSLAAYRYAHGWDEAGIRESLESGMPGRPTISSLEAYFLLYLEAYDQTRPGPEKAYLSDHDRTDLKKAIKEDQELAKHLQSVLEWIEDYRNTLFDDWKKRFVQKIEFQIQEPAMTKEAQQLTDRWLQRWRKEGFLVKTG